MNARRKNLIVAFALAFVGVLTFLAFKSLYHPAPFYNGKPLSAWAEQWGSNHWWTHTSQAAEADREAETAIRAIGKDGIPFLLDLMQTRDSFLKKKLRTALPPVWHARLHLIDMSPKTRRIGAHGLAALGTNAATTVPALIEIATHHPEEDGRYLAVFAIRSLGSAAEPAIPFLIQCLTNKSRAIRGDAALGLSNIHRRPDIIIPALIKYLEFGKTLSGSFEVTDAIHALVQFGTNAKPAVPVLLSLLNAPTPHVRAFTSNSLPMIDAEAAAEAHVQRH